jgi:NitT/TauT family transport system permease protein
VSKRLLAGLVLIFSSAVCSCAQTLIRVGAFPNITHAQAMVGKANGWFDRAMGPQVKVQWTSFNAGPAAIEALFGVASSKFLEETMGGLLVSLQSLPSICWWPLALLWFGLSQNAILFVVIMGSLLSVTLSMEDGRKQMPKIYSLAGRNLGASGFRLFWHVLLPASLPFLVSGLKQGWAFAWRSLITAEMLYLSLGLGQVLMMGRDLNDMSSVIAVMILIIAIGYVVDGIVFKSMERHLQHRWGLTSSS